MFTINYKNELTEQVKSTGFRCKTREEAQRICDARNRSYLAIYTFKHFFVEEV